MPAKYPIQYDAKIKLDATSYLPQWHWMWVKAQLIAESALDANAVSRVGARGLAQFMPATWDDVRAALRFPATASPFDPEYAIKGAAWYLSQLRRQWRSPRPEADRMRLVQASYNSGVGNVIKAQQLADGAIEYDSIIAQLHRVTGDDNAKETRDYVARIGRIYNELVGV